ncbi:SWIM zinc finger domain-containing protein [Chlorobaculum sp. 24CR]|uniref:SWIM zinc finger family protein n=1 Tax=Chlorobaculum sp. 24CR TaxID=2508878 RepID=UPI001430E97D|nr:SWIM zinc finger family protein [Chlorobaculum sp. 24CR]
MRIPLNRFDECIDPPMLKRGLTCFRNGQVSEPVEGAPGEFEATVEGTEPYTVRLVIDRGELVEHVCSCPYDMGPVCKHVAAVLFYLRKDELGLKVKKASTNSAGAKKPSKRKTVAQRVDALLDAVDPGDLKQFVREQASQNVQFRNLVLATFATLGSGESKSFYTQQLTAILRSAKDRSGFIGWSESNRVARGVANILEMARKQFEARNEREGLLVCMAVMEKLVGALQYADDSDGSIGDCISDAYAMMLGVAQSQPAASVRKQLLDYCMKAVEKRLYDGWNWHLGMLRMAAELVESDEERRALLAALEREGGSRYSGQAAQALKYGLMAKTGGEAAADAWLEANLGNPELRRIALRKAMESRDFDKVRRIAEDGIAHDKPKYPGLVIEWRDWLLKIAQAQGDRELVIQYARTLFFQSNRFQENYYAILKQQIEPERWVPFVEELFGEIESSRKPYIPQELLAGIFISEGWMERLLSLVRQLPTLHTIEEYESRLAGQYSAELVELYAQAIADYLKANVGRNHYQEACRYLRRMIKLGGREKANGVIADLRRLYSQRRALMEELARV